MSHTPLMEGLFQLSIVLVGDQVCDGLAKIPKELICQGRSKTRPAGRSKTRPVAGSQVVEYSGVESAFGRWGTFAAALFEAEAVDVHLEDVDGVGEAVEQGSGQPFRAEDLGPLL